MSSGLLPTVRFVAIVWVLKILMSLFVLSYLYIEL